jgi:hypothetical protein
MSVDQPARTVLAPLPSVAVSLGQTITSPLVSIPLGLQNVVIELDATGWFAGTVVDCVVQLTDDNGSSWVSICKATFRKDELVSFGGKGSLGVEFVFPNGTAAKGARGVIKLVAGTSITLVGSVFTV